MKNWETKHCWTAIGIRGDRSCPELVKHVHCRNCQRYESAVSDLLDREPPEAYLKELTRMIAEPEIKKDGNKQTVMVFRIGSEWLAMPVGFLVELTRPCPVRSVPHRSNHIFLGLVSIRGDMQLCFSVGGLLGIQPAEDGEAFAKPSEAKNAIFTLRSQSGAKEGKKTPSDGIIRRFCVVSRQNRTQATPGAASPRREWVFPADEVYGLGSYAENELQAVPVTVAKTLQKYTLGIIAVNNRQTGLLNDDLVFAGFERSLS